MITILLSCILIIVIAMIIAPNLTAVVLPFVVLFAAVGAGIFGIFYLAGLL